MYDSILDVCKRRGIVYPSFEVYGGVSGFIDYGPIGSRIKENVENLIRRYYLIDEGGFEVQCPTLSPEDVWVASGHVDSFVDKMTECTKCGEPYRADHLVEDGDKLSVVELEEKLAGVKCPKCKSPLDKPYDYNLMFGTYVGPGKYKLQAYLRPETAQTTYLAFRRLYEVARRKLPFGVIQIGRSYRNEISPRQGMIRLREFNQAEYQYFVDPEKKDDAPDFDLVKELHVRILTGGDEEVETSLNKAYEGGIIKLKAIAYFLGKSVQLFADMGVNPDILRLRQHRDNERAFYSTDTWDVEYESPSIGRIELVGVSDRTDYDLTAHMKLSKQDYRVNVDGRKFVPHVIEVAYGVDRPIYCILESCYVEADKRTYFKFPKQIAPYLAGVFSLVEKDRIPGKVHEVFTLLRDAGYYVYKDTSGSIGKKYARADEIGVPYSITVDYETLEDESVTVRERDTRQQERVRIQELVEYLRK